MLKIFFVLLGIAVVIWFVRPLREWLLDELKDLSDRLLLLFLSLTSRFESELTQDGRAEQALWREQRLRNIRGLALRSRQRFEESHADGSERS